MTSKMQTLQSSSNLIQVEQTLTKNTYFSRGPLPGFADAVIFKLLNQNKKYPEKKIYPNFYHWYIIIKQFAQQALQGWIREKRYVQNQSEKSIMLISELFMKNNRHEKRQPRRKKSLDSCDREEKRQITQNKSSKLQPLDINFLQNHQQAEYMMIISLKSIQNLEQLFNRFYKFKIKIKQLKINKKQKSVFLKFTTEIRNFDSIKNQIIGWDEVHNAIHKISKHFNQTDSKKRVARTVSIR